MKKKIQCILSALFMVWFGLSSYGQEEFTVGDFKYKITSTTEKTVEIVDYTGPATSVTIPGTVTYQGTGFDVTAMGYGVFEDDQLTSVVIPEGFTHIATSAFRDNQLNTVTLPNSVTSIGTNAFRGNQLTEVTLPNNLTHIWSSAFGNNPLVSVTAKATNPPAIQASSFSNRHQIDVVVPPGKEQAYLDAGWTGFNSITEELGVGDNFTVDGIEYQVTTQGNTNTVMIVDYTGPATSVTIPGTVTYQGTGFDVTRIGNNAFADNQLNTVTLPNSVASIGASAFWNNPPLTRLLLQADTPPTLGNGTFQSRGNINVIVPKDALDNYVPAWNAYGFKSITEEVEVGIGNDFIVEGITYNITALGSTNTVTATDNTNTGDLTIPETVFHGPNTFEVTNIGVEAFFNNQLASVTIPGTVTHIGQDAFSRNPINKVTVEPNHPPTLDADAFRGLNNTDIRNQIDLIVPVGALEAYKEPVGWTGFRSINEEVAVVGATFTIEGITYEVTALGSTNTVTIVGYTGSATSVTIPQTVGHGPNTYTVTAIGGGEAANQQPFYNKGLTSVIIPNTVTSIGIGAFNSNNLTEVTIPDGVTNIPKWAFAQNDLRELTIPASVEHIGEQAFLRSFNLSIVRVERIPATTIHATAFELAGFSVRPGKIDLVVPFGRIQDYKDAGWMVSEFGTITSGITIIDGIKYGLTTSPVEATVVGNIGNDFNLSIPPSVDIGGSSYPVTAIGDGALPNAGVKPMQTVVIPETVRSIGPRAFYGSSLNRVTVMADEPPELDPDAFEYPHRTEIEVIVPKGREQAYRDAGWTGFKEIFSLIGRFHRASPFDWEVTSLIPNKMELLRYWGALDSPEVPSEVQYLANSLNDNMYTVTSIGDEAFKGRGLTSVLIPNTVDRIGFGAFQDNQLTSIEIPDVVTYIGSSAFGNNQLTEVDIPEGVTHIGEDAFWENQLTSIEIPESVTSLGQRVFGHNNLTEVILPNGITRIEQWAFSRNDLKEVIIPANVEHIGEQAFLDNDLEEVTISGNVRTIDLYAFQNNSNLRLVTVEANNPPRLHELAFSNADRGQIDLVVPTGKKQEYLDNGWDGFRSISYGIFTVDNITYGIISRTEVMVVDYTGTATEVTIPETADNGEFPYAVTAIWENALQNKGLTSVGIPNSVTAIGERAFNGNQLTEVTLPGSVVSIGPQAFNNNPDLALVTVGADDPPVLDTTAFANANRHQIDLVVPAGRKQEYLDNGWGGFKSISEKIGVSIDAPAETVNLSPFTVTIQFDVEVTGFAMDDIDLVNATANEFIGSGSTYIVEIAPISCNGTVQIDVPENVTDMFNLPATATVTVEEDPNYLVANAKDIIVELGANGQATILPEDVDNGSAYGCDGTPELSLDIDTFDCSDVGAPVTVTLTATQGTESATATALVTVEESPLVANAKDIIVELGANGQATISPEDLDDGSAYGCDGTPELSLDMTNFDCSHVGVPVTVTLTATAGNQTDISTAVVTVENTINSLVAIAQDITVQLNADGMAFIGPGEIDNGSGSGCNNTSAISLSLDRTIFTCDDMGMATVVLTATQGSETATATATVTVQEPLDNLEAMAKDITVQLDASGQATILPEDVDDGSVYGCGSTPELSLDINTFDCDDVDTPVTVTLTAAQGNNSDTATAMVTVEASGDCGTLPTRPNPALVSDFNRGFSPNGDGIGDTLVIEGLEHYRNNLVKIYDLSQRLLFSAHYGGPGDAWDGTDKNGMVPVGSYVCVIDYNEPGLGHEAKMIYVNY